MTNREKLNNTALYDLLMKLHENVGEAGCIIELLEGALPFFSQLCESYGGCEECLQGYLNEEVNTMTTMVEAARKAADGIRVGDEVKDCEAEIGIVFDRKDNKYLVVYFDLAESDIYSGESERGELKKTGRHFPQVEERLAALGGENIG
ncbi:MAG: hypothetical protein IJ723_00945 [Ruminococcus sp.]|nr:hypothetical protein [Ruminococcus sp.]